jgi:iron complex transport system substrate-binding protein
MITITDRSRRQFLTGTLGVGVALLGCGDDDDGPTTAPRGRYPLTVRHRYGTTKIPAAPRRVVSVGLTDQDALFALGVEPVASQPWYAERVVYPWAGEVAPQAETALLPMGDALSIEAVAARRPDLIVGVSAEITEEQYAQLSEFAPTIASPPGDTTSWQAQTTIIGRALAREGRAKRLIAGVERAFADAADRHPQWRGKTAVLASQYIDGKLLVYPASDPATSFLTKLGFEPAPGLEEFHDDALGVPALSAERLDLIDVDLILWDGVRENLEASGLFDLATYRNLDAVREGRQVFPSATVADALSFKSVLSLPWALERLEGQIATAVGG